ncbi:MAG: cbb3-type cytochrome oxidase assembly protein CcoS [Zoogloeaceae bacterium]|nr:cbb3-type cytochrome oxidase assembly protein CcoS [Zoogloeaceae bacterium]
MEALYLLIPFSVALVFVIAFIFWKSVRGGQFDDLEGPGFRILMDDDLPPPARNPAETPAHSSQALENDPARKNLPE